MKINWGYEFKSLDGEVTKDEKGIVDTLAKAAIIALMSLSDDERQMAGDEKLKRYDLAFKIKNSPDEDFSIDEVKLAKDQIFKKHFPLIVGQASRILENKEEQK